MLETNSNASMTSLMFPWYMVDIMLNLQWVKLYIVASAPWCLFHFAKDHKFLLLLLHYKSSSWKLFNFCSIFVLKWLFHHYMLIIQSNTSLGLYTDYWVVCNWVWLAVWLYAGYSLGLYECIVYYDWNFKALTQHKK